MREGPKGDGVSSALEATLEPPSEPGGREGVKGVDVRDPEEASVKGKRSATTVDPEKGGGKEALGTGEPEQESSPAFLLTDRLGVGKTVVLVVVEVVAVLVVVVLVLVVLGLVVLLVVMVVMVVVMVVVVVVVLVA